MSEEWGPWIKHDGKSCPRGEVVIADFQRAGILGPFIAGCEGGGSWVYGRASDIMTYSIDKDGARCDPVLRYRIRKPKGLTLLQEIARNPERELEDA